MRRAAAPLAALLTACTEPAPAMPVVWLDVVEPAPAQGYLEGARIWEALGFEVTLEHDEALPQCPRSWRVGDPADCELSIGVWTVDELDGDRLGRASSDLRQVWVLRDTGRPWLVAAHEVGHVLLDTSGHADGVALMAPTTAQISETLTAGDYELACSSIGWCR